MTTGEKHFLVEDLPLITDDRDITFYYSRHDNRMGFSTACMEQFGIPRVIDYPNMDFILELFVPKDISRLKSSVLRCIMSKETAFYIDFVAYDSDGQERELYAKIVAAYDEAGFLEAAKGLVLDLNLASFISLYDEEQSYKDRLTKLPNHKAFNRDWELLSRKAGCVGYVMMLDIDNLKQINNTFGVSAGEKVIWHVGSKLPKLIKKQSAEIYRLLGDKYALILQDASAQKAEKVMDRIVNNFRRETIGVNGKKIRITISAGAVAYFSGLDFSSEKILLNAEIAVQKVKQNGKDGFSFYSRGDGILYKQQFDLLSDIDKAVKAGFQGFELYYQPIYAANDSRCQGAEALLRWRSPNQTLIMPNVFVPILEKTGLIAEVEKWIFKTACEQCQKWISSYGNGKFFIHINLSPRQITRDTLYDEVMSAVRDSGLSPANLILESTESSMMLEFEKGVSLFHKLREQGIRVAVDDFGTGYSSLSYLKYLPVDEIKVDKSFVTNIENDVASKDFLSGIVNIIRSMEYKVCVEGVETDLQKDLLIELQVDLLQGFLFSKPLPSHEFEILIKQEGIPYAQIKE